MRCFRVTPVPPTHFSSAPPGGDRDILFTAQFGPRDGSALLGLLSGAIVNGTQTIRCE